MGRRSVSLADEDRWVFNRLADAYRARPPYPAQLVDLLARIAGGPGSRVADLGAGTGHLALPLAAHGFRVSAVEPSRAMLEVLRARLAPDLPLEPVHAAAESTGLPGGAFALVLVADAVHWLDPELAGAEAARLLAPGGAAAVVEAKFAATPFMDGLAALLARANPRARPRPPGAARQLPALLRSLSYAGPALGPAALAALEREACALAGAGGARLVRDLTVRHGRRPRAARAARS